MATGALSSDHVNYLIWRYLQEAGYGQAAVKLQQYWLREADPQSLPFASRISRRALVALVQKGLKYNQIEAAVTNPPSLTTDGAPVTAATAFFGTATSRQPPVASVSESTSLHRQEHSHLDASNITTADTSASTNPPLTTVISTVPTHQLIDLPAPSVKGKRPLESLESPIKTPEADQKRRRSADDTGYAPPTEPQWMEVDHSGIGAAPRPAEFSLSNSRSPEQHPRQDKTGTEITDRMDLDQEPPPMLSTLIEGQSIGIQSDQVRDLGPLAMHLVTPEEDQVMHTAWNTQDSALLATGGQGHCRIWSLTGGASGPTDMDIKSIPREIPLPSETAYITSIAWSPDGQVLALATQANADDTVGTVSTWTSSGMALDELTAGQELVIQLCWNDDGSMLLGIASSGDGMSSLIVWDMAASQTLPPVQCNKIITDATWTGHHTITVCGHGAIGRWDLSSPQGLMWAMKLDPQITDGRWTNLCYDPMKQMLAVFEEDSAKLVLIDANGNIASVQQAHAQPLTAFSRSFPRTQQQSSPLLATAALDGTIIKRESSTFKPEVTYKFSTSESPALALSFSPDGDLLAAANQTKVLLFQLSQSHVTTPVAIWRNSQAAEATLDSTGNKTKQLANGNGAITSRYRALERTKDKDKDSGIGDDADNEDEEHEDDEDSVSLGWNSNGTLLAVSCGSQTTLLRVEL